MSQEEFAQFWPNLTRIGFGAAKAREVLEGREAQLKCCDQLSEGLDHAEAAVEMGLERMAKGGKVDNELAYVFYALLRTGYFDRPPGYLTAKERFERDEYAKMASLQQTAREIEEIRFEMWRSSLVGSQIRAIRDRNPANKCMPQETMLRLEWVNLDKPMPELPGLQPEEAA